MSDEKPVPEPAVAHRRKRPPSVEEVFGEVLPETTRDERSDLQVSAEQGRDSRDEDLLRDVPPHHS